MEIGIVARHTLRLNGIVLIARRQLLNLIVDILAHQIALFDPSRFAACGAHFDEAPVMVEHLDALAIFHDARFFVDRSYMIAQVGLDAGDIRDFEHASASAIAAREGERAGEAQRHYRPSSKGRGQRCREELHRMNFYYSAARSRDCHSRESKPRKTPDLVSSSNWLVHCQGGRIRRYCAA